jgi:hypothetical protein
MSTVHTAPYESTGLHSPVRLPDSADSTDSAQPGHSTLLTPRVACEGFQKPDFRPYRYGHSATWARLAIIHAGASSR